MPPFLYSVPAIFPYFGTFSIYCIYCLRFRLKIWHFFPEIYPDREFSLLNFEQTNPLENFSNLWQMADPLRPTSIEDLPSHLILEILSCGKLSVVDLVCLELASRIFRGSHGVFPPNFQSLVDFAAFQLCGSHPIYAPMSPNAQEWGFQSVQGELEAGSEVLAIGGAVVQLHWDLIRQCTTTTTLMLPFSMQVFRKGFCLGFRHWVIDPVISLWWLYTCTYMVGNMKLVFLIRLFFAIAIKLLNQRPSVRNDHHQLVVHSNAWGGQSLCQNATGTSICLFKWK